MVLAGGPWRFRRLQSTFKPADDRSPSRGCGREYSRNYARRNQESVKCGLIQGGERETYGKQQSSTWTSQRCQPIFWNTLRGMPSGCKTDVFQHENQFHRAGLQAVRPTYSNMKIKSIGFIKGGHPKMVGLLKLDWG